MPEHTTNQVEPPSSHSMENQQQHQQLASSHAQEQFESQHATNHDTSFATEEMAQDPQQVRAPYQNICASTSTTGDQLNFADDVDFSSSGDFGANEEDRSANDLAPVNEERLFFRQPPTQAPISQKKKPSANENERAHLKLRNFDPAGKSAAMALHELYGPTKEGYVERLLPGNQRAFTCTLTVGGLAIAGPEAPTKKQAKQVISALCGEKMSTKNAAIATLEKLRPSLGYRTKNAITGPSQPGPVSEPGHGARRKKNGEGKRGDGVESLLTTSALDQSKRSYLLMGASGLSSRHQVPAPSELLVRGEPAARRGATTALKRPVTADLSRDRSTITTFTELLDHVCAERSAQAGCPIRAQWAVAEQLASGGLWRMQVQVVGAHTPTERGPLSFASPIYTVDRPVKRVAKEQAAREALRQCLGLSERELAHVLVRAALPALRVGQAGALDALNVLLQKDAVTFDPKDESRHTQDDRTEHRCVLAIAGQLITGDWAPSKRAAKAALAEKALQQLYHVTTQEIAEMGALRTTQILEESAKRKRREEAQRPISYVTLLEEALFDETAPVSFATPPTYRTERILAEDEGAAAAEQVDVELDVIGSVFRARAPTEAGAREAAARQALLAFSPEVLEAAELARKRALDGEEDDDDDDDADGGGDGGDDGQQEGEDGEEVSASVVQQLQQRSIQPMTATIAVQPPPHIATPECRAACDQAATMYMAACERDAFRPCNDFAAFLLVSKDGALQPRLLAFAGAQPARSLPGAVLVAAKGHAVHDQNAWTLARRALQRALLVELNRLGSPSCFLEREPMTVQNQGAKLRARLKPEHRLVFVASRAPNLAGRASRRLALYDPVRATTSPLPHASPPPPPPLRVDDLEKDGAMMAVHARADKFYRWMQLGIQGALLSRLLVPIRPAAFYSVEPLDRGAVAEMLAARLQDDKTALTVDFDASKAPRHCADERGQGTTAEPHLWYSGIEGMRIEVLSPETGRVFPTGVPSTVSRREMLQALRRCARDEPTAAPPGLTYGDVKDMAREYAQKKDELLSRMTQAGWGVWRKTPRQVQDWA